MFETPQNILGLLVVLGMKKSRNFRTNCTDDENKLRKVFSDERELHHRRQPLCIVSRSERQINQKNFDERKLP